MLQATPQLPVTRNGYPAAAEMRGSPLPGLVRVTAADLTTLDCNHWQDRRQPVDTGLRGEQSAAAYALQQQRKPGWQVLSPAALQTIR